MEGSSKEDEPVETGIPATPTSDETNIISTEKNGENTGITEERWYEAQDGSYFQEPREPFFYFNLLAYTIAMAFFIYFAVVITQDFVDQQKDPPTSSKLHKEIEQPFPGFIICNRDDAAPLDVILAELHTNSASNVDISNKIEPLDCGDGRKCILMSGTFPAYAADPDNTKACSGANALVIALDINLGSYSSETSFVGIDGFLFVPGASEQVATSFCSEMAPRCQSLAPSFEVCPEDITTLSFEPFIAPSGQGNLVSLVRSEVQFAPGCDQMLLDWNPSITSMKFNPALLTIAVTDSVVFMEFEFKTPLVMKTSYNPISGQSMFGSLSGWFGFLTG